MGQLISGPVTFKDTKLWQNSQYSVAASSMQGWRVRMEDYYSCFLNLSSDSPSPHTAYFAVFDGHGGTKISEYAATHLHSKIMVQPAYGKGDIPEAIRQGVNALDAEMQAKFTGMPVNTPIKLLLSSTGTDNVNVLEEGKSSNSDVGGSTCIALMLRDKKVYCANCGDSRAVLSRLGVAETLSVDHKPAMASEWTRIVAAGGWVAGNRVNGNLALSRALGDFRYKGNTLLAPEEQIISAMPDVSEYELKLGDGGADEFIVIGCDGIWDVMTNQEVISFVRYRLANGHPPDSICEELMMHCLAPSCNPNGLGCDNMTLVIVCFLNGAPYDDLQKRCARPCSAGACIDIVPS